MAMIERLQGRIWLAVRVAVQKVLAEGDSPLAEEGVARFTTIETLALAAGDAVTLEVFEQQVAECGVGDPHSPRYGFAGPRPTTPTVVRRFWHLA